MYVWSEDRVEEFAERACRKYGWRYRPGDAYVNQQNWLYVGSNYAGKIVAGKLVLDRNA